mgnify:CR=1 FL=1
MKNQWISINDILIGVHKADGEYVTIPDRKEAIKYCMEHAGAGDIVLLQFPQKNHHKLQLHRSLNVP